MTAQLAPLVIMGVSGSGKSTIGELLATALDLKFVDGDTLHPQANKDKMRRGIPLDDFDRTPWLHIIGQHLAQRDSTGRPVIIACSALKRSYRDLLRTHDPRTRFVFLIGGSELIQQRLDARDHEYMPSSLLHSQLETLEEPSADEQPIRVDITLSPQAIVASVIAQLSPDAS